VRPYVLAQFANDFGTWFGRIAALTVLAQHSARLAALVVVADTLPRVLASPLLARRGEARPVRMIVGCCLGEAAVLAVAAGVGDVPAAVIALFALRSGLDAALYVTFQGMVARLPMDRDRLLRANFQLSLASAAAILSAPVAAGVLTTSAGLRAMLLVDAASYLVMLGLLAGRLRAVGGWAARPAPAGRAPRPPAAANPLLWSSAAATLAGGCFNALLPALFLGVLGDDGRDLGAALTLFGVGTVIVNLAGSRIRRLPANAALVVALVTGGVLLGALAGAPSAGTAFPVVLAFGAAAALRGTTTRYLVQVAGGAEPTAMLARWQAVNNLGLLLGSAVALVLATPGLVRPALVGLGCLYAAGAVALINPRRAAATAPAARPPDQRTPAPPPGAPQTGAPQTAAPPTPVPQAAQPRPAVPGSPR
jgi:hypothetical protein